MATTATGIWASTTAGQNVPSITAVDTSAKAADSSSDGDSSTISANDFLTLLVTEMQNQDPTATTDPNEYINQLVGVNSLQQLISINQTLSGAASKPSSHSVPAASAPSHPLSSGPVHATPAIPVDDKTFAGVAMRRISGNLSVPAPNAAAQSVAHSLDGHKASM